MKIRKILIQFILPLALSVGGGSLLFISTSTKSENANRDTGTIVVSNRGSGDLTLIDVVSDTATALAMPAGDNLADPMYIVYSRGKVFVGDRGNNRVVVFDYDNWNVIDEIPTGSGVVHMAGQTHRNQLWVCNDIDNTITIIDIGDHTVIDTIELPTELVADGGKAHDVILDNTAAYVTMIGLSGDSDVVIKYSLQNFNEMARANVGKTPHVALSQYRNTLYVATEGSDEVQVLRRNNLREIKAITVPNAHGINITPAGGIAYITNIADGGVNALYTIDARKKKVIGDPVDTPHPTPHNIEITYPDKKLYVTHSGATANKVTVFRISKEQPVPVFLKEIDAGLNPFGIEFIPY